MQRLGLGRHGLRGDVDGVGPGAEPEVDVVGGVPGLVVHGRLVGRVLPEQEALGQRRPLVRQPLLPREQDDPPLEPLVAQGLHGLGAGEATADDDVRLTAHHPTLVAEWSNGQSAVQRRRAGVGEGGHLVHDDAQPAGVIGGGVELRQEHRVDGRGSADDECGDELLDDVASAAPSARERPHGP